MPILSSVIKIAPIVARYAKTFGKFTSGETAFVSRFPPRYRDTARTIIKGASTVTYGGLISDILKGINDDGTPSATFQKKSSTNQQRKTRNRFRGNSYNERGFKHKRHCRCSTKRRPNNFRSRRR